MSISARRPHLCCPGRACGRPARGRRHARARACTCCENGHTVRLAADETLGHDRRRASRPCTEAELVLEAGLVVAVGGDGTMLHAARMAAMVDVPVLGINRGRLGFLADVNPDRMLESVADALSGRCLAERRSMLAAQLSVGGRDTSPRSR